MQAGYFSTAWNDIKNSPGWVGKMFLLSLVNLIPIFGQMVIYGYLYGWARDIAWGVHKPMPKQIFGNEDGKLYSRGFYLLVVAVVFALVPMVFYFISSMLSIAGTVPFTSSSRASSAASGSVFVLMILSMLFSLITFAVSLAVAFFQNVSFMRVSIYGRLSAGFQIKKIWAMLKKDFVGLLRIFGMVLLLGLIIGIVLSTVITIIVFIFIAAGFSMFSGSLLSSSSSAPGVGEVLGFSLAIFFVSIIVGYFFSVLYMFVSTMNARALGYWTRQFDVPAWRGQDDPMPFELQAQPVPTQAPQASYGQPEQPPVSGQPQSYQQTQSASDKPSDAGYQPPAGAAPIDQQAQAPSSADSTEAQPASSVAPNQETPSTQASRTPYMPGDPAPSSGQADASDTGSKPSDPGQPAQ